MVKYVGSFLTSHSAYPYSGLRQDTGRCCRMSAGVVTYPCPGPSHPDGTWVIVAGWLLLLLLTPVQDPATQTGHGSLLQDCARTLASGSQSPSAIIAPCTSRHLASLYLAPLPQVAEHWKGRRFEFIRILAAIYQPNTETWAGMRRYWMPSLGLWKEMIRCRQALIITELEC